MDISEPLLYDLQNKLEITEDMIHEFEHSKPQKALELRGRLYAIQVLLNEIEDEFLEMTQSLN